VPADADQPGKVSGIRLGTGAISARDMGADEVQQLVGWMDRIMAHPEDTAIAGKVRDDVTGLCSRFPLNKN
jgi:glycine hydroxymethyltransferase